MRFALLTAGLMLAASAHAQKAPPPAAGNDVIVVTGVSLDDAKAALAACLARACPPDQDIAATIAVAEIQFVDGDYLDARRTLRASARRNRRHGDVYPVPVSNLLRADARVSSHLGDPDARRSRTLDVVTVLKSGLGGDSPDAMVAEIELGDMFAGYPRLIMAEEIYDRVADRARRLGHPKLEGFARLRVANMYAQAAEFLDEYRHRANRELAELIETSDPRQRVFALAGRVIKARLDARDGDSAAIDRLIGELRREPLGPKPTLVYSEPIDLSGGADGGSAAPIVSMRSVTNQWIDVAFWVGTDGRTQDVEVLRRSPTASQFWIEPVLKAIRSRRYLPGQAEPGDPGALRVERYTCTYPLSSILESRIKVRSTTPKIEMLDLTEENGVARPVGGISPSAN
jgi:hypothetical protein